MRLNTLTAKKKGCGFRYRRGESNPRPSPCKGDIITTRLLLRKSTMLQVYLDISCRILCKLRHKCPGRCSLEATSPSDDILSKISNL